MELKTIGVVGAGIMGSGVAQNLAQTGHNVILMDISQAQLDSSKQEILKNIRLQTLFDKSKHKPNADQIMASIIFTDDLRKLRNVQYLIENVTEKWSIKNKVYQELDDVCPKEVVFASNTSAIPITRIGSATSRPSKVIGVHFMNPVPLKKTVEMIISEHTSENTIEITKNLLTAMGKKYILVNDSPGFVSNRVLMLTINEAIFLVQNQVADARDIDQIFKSCLGHKMGPLETGDMIGLDTVLLSLNVLYESFQDSKYQPCPLLKKMVDAGLLGRKSKQGFYQY
jgi:3-hydroxybutyryl-CoA dehydrogenase